MGAVLSPINSKYSNNRQPAVRGNPWNRTVRSLRRPLLHRRGVDARWRSDTELAGLGACWARCGAPLHEGLVPTEALVLEVSSKISNVAALRAATLVYGQSILTRPYRFRAFPS